MGKENIVISLLKNIFLSFMKHLTKLLLCGALICAQTTVLLAQKAPEDKAGWKLGAQAYSFRLFPFAEALRKIDSCGLKNVEAFPGQPIGGGIKGSMDFMMDAATRQSVKKM